MKTERWHQLDKLFHSALEREPGERATFLDEACAGDEASLFPPATSSQRRSLPVSTRFLDTT